MKFARQSKDRISQLPEALLHQILSHVSPKRALRTCVLSKAWRHVASTRPNVELREEGRPFKTNRETFFSFLDTTLQRYLDHNLPIQVLVLYISYADNPDAVSLLDKWIPVVANNMPVDRLDLSFESNYYHLPPIVLRSESLQELHLRTCSLTRIRPTDPILLTRLRNLSLTNVYASDQTLERMISRIERVTLTRCYVSGAIKVNSNNLKHFSLLDGSSGRLTIEFIDAPSIETITITGHDNWIHATNHSSFARLKSLSLKNVRLSENSFATLSDPDCFGCLEDLTLSYCHGFKEFRLTSTSVKNLTLNLDDKNFDIDVDVPNIVCFELSYFNRQPSIFFTTTSREWKSEISFIVTTSRVYNTKLLLNVYQFHKAALSNSEFSLRIQDPSELVRREEIEDYGVFVYPPAVVIESLSMWVIKHSSSSAAAFLRHLFCFFHPRFIYANKYEYPKEAERRPWYSNKEYCLVGILVHAQIPGLEEVSIESFRENGEQSSNESDRNIRLRLKWGQLNSLQA